MLRLFEEGNRPRGKPCVINCVTSNRTLIHASIRIDEERGDLYIELILRASSVFHPSLCPLKCHRSRVSIIVKEMRIKFLRDARIVSCIYRMEKGRDMIFFFFSDFLILLYRRENIDRIVRIFANVLETVTRFVEQVFPTDRTFYCPF